MWQRLQVPMGSGLRAWKNLRSLLPMWTAEKQWGIGVSPGLVLWNQNKVEADPTHGRPGPQTTCEILDPSFHGGRTV